MFNLKRKSDKGPVDYTVVHRPRVTKRMHLELDGDGGLVLVTPKSWSRALIKKTVAQNSQQISRFMARAAKQQLQPLQYRLGAQHLYLGQPTTLLLIKPGTPVSHLPLTDLAGSANVLNLPCGSSDPAIVKQALQRYYRQQATHLFGDRLKLIAERAHWVQHAEIPLSIRRMKRTWGNCSSSGKIKLNVHLIKAPLEIVDSVIAHELCHLKEMNHSKRFYALLQELNPDWLMHRAFLRANGFRYLQE